MGVSLAITFTQISVIILLKYILEQVLNNKKHFAKIICQIQEN